MKARQCTSMYVISQMICRRPMTLDLVTSVGLRLPSVYWHWAMQVVVTGIVFSYGWMVTCPARADDFFKMVYHRVEPIPAEKWAADRLDRCPTREMIQKTMKPISDIAFRLQPEKEPTDCFEEVHPLSGEYLVPDAPRFAAKRHFHWKASGLLHNPLYFEEVSLERYGHTRLLQPLFSGFKFFANAAFLPYRIGVDGPCERIYTLGYERPGNCLKPVVERVPFSLKGAALQAGAATGVVFLFP